MAQSGSIYFQLLTIRSKVLSCDNLYLKVHKIAEVGKNYRWNCSRFRSKIKKDGSKQLKLAQYAFNLYDFCESTAVENMYTLGGL